MTEGSASSSSLPVRPHQCSWKIHEGLVLKLNICFIAKVELQDALAPNNELSMNYQKVFWFHWATQAQSLRRTAPLTWSSPGGAWTAFLVRARTDACRCTVTLQFHQNIRLITTFKHLKYEMGIMSMRFMLLERQLRKAMCLMQTNCNLLLRLMPWSCVFVDLQLLWMRLHSPLFLLAPSVFSHFVLDFYRFSVFLLQLRKAKCTCMCVCKPLFHRFPNWDKGSVCAAHQRFWCKSHMNIAVNLDNGIKLVKRL